MPKKVPYLREEQIERDAEALLAEYERARGILIVAPVPIDDIVEKYLKLGVEFDDMHQLFDVPRSREPDILGAILFDERRIVIDESIDPEETPSNEGRYRFTLAHEAGHWRLHGHLFSKDSAQVSLLNEQAQPALVCRSSNAKEPIEWQADFYAACLLMPRRLVCAIWRERFGSLHPFIYEWNRANPAFAPRRSSWVKLVNILQPTPDHLLVFNRIAREFAQVFCVSVETMRIRLENLGLLLCDVPRQRSRA